MQWMNRHHGIVRKRTVHRVELGLAGSVAVMTEQLLKRQCYTHRKYISFRQLDEIIGVKLWTQ